MSRPFPAYFRVVIQLPLTEINRHTSLRGRNEVFLFLPLDLVPAGSLFQLIPFPDEQKATLVNHRVAGVMRNVLYNQDGEIKARYFVAAFSSVRSEVRSPLAQCLVGTTASCVASANFGGLKTTLNFSHSPFSTSRSLHSQWRHHLGRVTSKDRMIIEAFPTPRPLSFASPALVRRLARPPGPRLHHRRAD